MNQINMISSHLRRSRGFSRLAVLRYTLALAMLLVCAEDSQAQMIGVNLGDSNFGGLSSGLSAGVVPQINWMNVGSTSAANIMLSDDSGALTSAELSYSNINGAANPIIRNLQFVFGGDELLNNSYLRSFDPAITFTITNVPYANYDLITYVSALNSGRTYSATVGATTLYGLSPDPIGPGYIDNASTPYTYTSAIGTTPGTATPNGNYFRFSGLTNSTLMFTMGSPDDVPLLTAFQIVAAVPEPSTWGLLACGAAGLIGWKSRHRKTNGVR